MTQTRPSQTTDPVAFARHIALRQLDRAPRTRAQLEKALDKRGVPGDVARLVLDRLVEVGLVDDAAYARMLVHSRTVTKGSGRRALRFELARKGCDDDVIAAALLDVTDEDERRMAAEQVGKRLRRLEGLDPQVRRRRLVGMLARKGYGSAVISAALADLD